MMLPPLPPPPLLLLLLLIIIIITTTTMSRDSTINMVTGSSPCHPDQLWGPNSILYNRYRALFPWGKAAGT
jgi:hypothetical protein